MKKTNLIFNCAVLLVFAGGILSTFAQGIHITPVDTIWPDTTTYDTRVSALSSLGDINGDGFEDLAIGFVSRRTSRALIYFGNPEGRFDNPWEYLFRETDEEWFNGLAVMKTIGDVNNDGWNDLALGMPDYTWNWTYSTGRAWIFYGGPGMDTIPDWQCSVDRYIYYHLFGTEIQNAGDWNGDGYDDFVISAPWNDMGGEGDVYLFLGGDPPDTSVYISWSGVEWEEHLDCIGSIDTDSDFKKELLITNISGYWADTIEGDTLTSNLFKRNEVTNDTLIRISFPASGDGQVYGKELSIWDSSNAVYSFFNKPFPELIPDSFFLANISFFPDSTIIENYNLREILSCYDTNLVPLLFNINAIKDLDGDYKKEIIGELYLSERTITHPSFFWRVKGRFIILDPNGDYNLLFTSDSLFSHDAFSIPKMTTLDFNGDARDEIFVGNTAFHEDEYGVLVFTTGDWEGIEEQKEITHQNSLAGSFGNTIHFDVNISARAEIDLFDISGRKIREEAIDVHKGCNSISFGKLNSGIYLYRIRFNKTDEILNGKLVNIN